MAKSKTILSLSYGSYFGGACIITIEKQDEDSDLCIIKGCNGYFYNAEFSIKKDSIDSIRETLDKVKQWNKEYKCPEDILDGFDWEVEFVTGKRRISRSGYMAYPENYNEVMQELIMFIEKLKKDELSSEDLFPPLDPFETEGYFVPVGENVIKKEHYRKCDFKTQITLWNRQNGGRRGTEKKDHEELRKDIEVQLSKRYKTVFWKDGVRCFVHEKAYFIISAESWYGDKAILAEYADSEEEARNNLFGEDGMWNFINEMSEDEILQAIIDEVEC